MKHGNKTGENVLIRNISCLCQKKYYKSSEKTYSEMCYGEGRYDLWENTQSKINFLLGKIILIKTPFHQACKDI